ncbi:MAG: amidohydrolase family protein [Acidobacteria bacterium]|nr:amidohydrolase family protein [Acidobacteriota bacterium]
MRRLTFLACLIAVSGASSLSLYSQGRGLAKVAIYEGARLIIGDTSAPIENGAFVVQQGKIVAIGQKGQIMAPPGATRVDLTGKTVMPALVNIHAHLGWEIFSASGDKEAAPENFTPENLLDHLERQAFYGVGTVLDAGSAPLHMSQQFQVDDDAAKFPSSHSRLMLMAGIVPPNGGPDSILIKGTQPTHANFQVLRAPEARAAVQMVNAMRIRHIKVWLGDRNGSYPAMPPQVYEAVIDEAHKVGIKVHAHASGSNFYQKEALRAGVDLIVHTIQNEKIDAELMKMLNEKKPYWTPVMGLGDYPEVCDADPFVDQMLPAKVIADIRASERCKPNPNAARREEMLKNNFMAMIDNGARLVLGTDTGVRPTYAFGTADHHEIRKYVQLGATPAQAIVAATSRPAEAMGLTDVGTLAVDKWADFLVLNANPLDDISNTRKIDSVYLRGAKQDRDALLAKWKKVSMSQ